jgi:hypothetical protein
MKSFAHDSKHLGAETGMISILHTWGQNLSMHPHIHCIVPAGGLTKAGFWKHARGDGKFLFPVKAMSQVFRARFVNTLRATIKDLDRSFYNDLFKTNWVVYAKRPFGGPKQVIEYLGRYTHKITISNHRIINITNDQVTFRYKDYRGQSKNKIMSLESREFIRRFSLHILPKGFMRIRHYGILSSSRKQKTLPVIHQQFNSPYQPKEKKDWKQISIEIGFNPDCCPVCKQQTMTSILSFDRRGPPDRSIIQSFKNKIIQRAIHKTIEA